MELTVNVPCTVRTVTVSVRNDRHRHVSEVRYDIKFKWKSQ